MMRAPRPAVAAVLSMAAEEGAGPAALRVALRAMGERPAAAAANWTAGAVASAACWGAAGTTGIGDSMARAALMRAQGPAFAAVASSANGVKIVAAASMEAEATIVAAASMEAAAHTESSEAETEALAPPAAWMEAEAEGERPAEASAPPVAPKADPTATATAMFAAAVSAAEEARPRTLAAEH